VAGKSNASRALGGTRGRRKVFAISTKNGY
jgi:hypothetical protein